MVYIFLGKGFEETEAVAPGDILRRGNVAVSYASANDEIAVAGAHGIKITADIIAKDITPEKEDVFVIPGGMGGVNSIKSSKNAMSVLEKASKVGCTMTAICAGPSVLAALGITDGKTITCYPGCEDLMGSAVCKTAHSTYVDGSIITGRAPGSALDFGLALLANIAGGDTAEKVRRDLVY